MKKEEEEVYGPRAIKRLRKAHWFWQGVIDNIQDSNFNEIGKMLKPDCRASLVAQWLRVCLPMQGTRVRALVWEDPTCRRAARPVSHDY